MQLFFYLVNNQENEVLRPKYRPKSFIVLLLHSLSGMTHLDIQKGGRQADLEKICFFLLINLILTNSIKKHKSLIQKL